MEDIVKIKNPALLKDFKMANVHYPIRSSLVMPLLHHLMRKDGFISEKGILEISSLTGLSPVFVKGVSTFYSFYFHRFHGKYVIQMCRNVACMYLGAERLIEHLINKYKLQEIGHGIYSRDDSFTLVITECIGACGIGPAMLVNGRLFGRLNTEKIDQLINTLLRDGESELPGSDVSIELYPMSREGEGISPGSLLFKTVDCLEISSYMEKGGYSAFKRAISMKPAEIIDIVKRSGLRGRGGAGFPTGMKWAFAAQDPKPPKYLIVNADEGEPGTFKDRVLLNRNPHQIIEGMLIGGYAIGADTGYIYLRYEYPETELILQNAINDARRAGFLGRRILDTDFSFDIFVHRGAGAYICGEETALIESIEGKRGQPRIRPPFPVNSGLAQKPTVVNNVETIANIPVILNIGPESYAAIGSRDTPGPKLFSISGVRKPGVYELPTGLSIKEIINLAGGPLTGKIKAVIPGGISTPVLTAEMLDCPADYGGLKRYNSMLGTGGMIVLGEDVCMVRVAMRAMGFYRHESCGKCTPCREGTGWLEGILKRIENGNATIADLELLEEISKNISGKTFCALGDAAACVLDGILRHFKNEFEEHIRMGGCPFYLSAEGNYSSEERKY